MEKTELPLVEEIDKQPNLEMIVQDLLNVKSSDVNWYFDFLGHKLYSDSVELDKAYIEVYNMTYSEYKEYLKDTYNKYKENEISSFKESIKVRFPENYIEKTKEYISFLKQEEINKPLDERLTIFDREITSMRLVYYFLGGKKELKKTK